MQTLRCPETKRRSVLLRCGVFIGGAIAALMSVAALATPGITHMSQKSVVICNNHAQCQGYLRDEGEQATKGLLILERFSDVVNITARLIVFGEQRRVIRSTMSVLVDGKAVSWLTDVPAQVDDGSAMTLRLNATQTASLMRQLKQARQLELLEGTPSADQRTARFRLQLLGAIDNALRVKHAVTPAPISTTTTSVANMNSQANAEQASASLQQFARQQAQTLCPGQEVEQQAYRLANQDWLIQLQHPCLKPASVSQQTSQSLYYSRFWLQVAPKAGQSQPATSPQAVSLTVPTPVERRVEVHRFLTSLPTVLIDDQVQSLYFFDQYNEAGDCGVEGRYRIVASESGTRFELTRLDLMPLCETGVLPGLWLNLYSAQPLTAP